MPDEVTAADLERSVRAELRSLSKANADEVARHLVMIGRLLPDDPDEAYAHAMAAQRRAGRVAVVREIVGVAAYHAGRWAEALSELRAARRMSGSSHVLPLMADAERGLGRPERALDLAASPEAQTLGAVEKVEMAIVVSGARRDLGQHDAAVVALQIPQLTSSGPPQPYTARLWYAYADALIDVGRGDEALHWFARAASVDHEGTTDADERLAELQGLHIVDLEDQSDDESEGADGPQDTAATVGSDPGSTEPEPQTNEPETSGEAERQPADAAVLTNGKSSPPGVAFSDTADRAAPAVGNASNTDV